MYFHKMSLVIYIVDPSIFITASSPFHLVIATLGENNKSSNVPEACANRQANVWMPWQYSSPLSRKIMRVGHQRDWPKSGRVFESWR